MRSVPFVTALLASALFSGAALAQAEGPSERTLGTTSDGKRIVSMVIYGNDACPEGKDGEIVVCARQPEEERYRLPKQFRKPAGSSGSAWGSRVSSVDAAGGSGIGSCSAVGSGGASGCNRQMMRAAKKEQQQKRAEERAVADEIANQ